MLQEDAKTKRSLPLLAPAPRDARRHVVDRVREALVELAERVVREGGEVDDGVDSLEVGELRRHGGRPRSSGGGRRRNGARSQPSYSRRIEADHVVAGSLEACRARLSRRSRRSR